MTVSRELSGYRLDDKYQYQYQFSGTAGQMRGQWHCTSRKIHIFLWKGE
jgi:hypothetical protein